MANVKGKHMPRGRSTLSEGSGSHLCHVEDDGCQVMEIGVRVVALRIAENIDDIVERRLEVFCVFWPPWDEQSATRVGTFIYLRSSALPTLSPRFIFINFWAKWGCLLWFWGGEGGGPFRLVSQKALCRCTCVTLGRAIEC